MPLPPRCRSNASTAELVARYAAGFNDQFADVHTVTSPLGVWLLLALAGSATSGADRARVEAQLGTTVADASVRAEHLLADPHPAVRAALAAWSQAALLTGPWDEVVASFPAGTTTGPVPTQANADAWAHEATGGLIGTFPTVLDPATMVVLASALATKVSWTGPLETADAGKLGGRFGTRVESCLVGAADATTLLVQTPSAGVVAVHVNNGVDDVAVLSVIADPSVPAGRVHRAAHEVLAACGGTRNGVRELNLFDLPLGEGHAWTLTERDVLSDKPRESRYTAYLPAWSAAGDHDVLGAPGVAAACAGLATFARPEARPVRFEARASTVASYTRTGFAAASATAVSMRAGSMPSARSRTVARTATVRFNRPHAVLAAAGGSVEAWSAVPLFSAWVTCPDNATD